MRRIEHQIIEGVEKKHCPKCDRWKPLEMFGIDRHTKDEFYCICKKCLSKWSDGYDASKDAQRNIKISEKAKGHIRGRKPHFFTNGIECKKCRECKEIKPITDFQHDKQRWDNLAPGCRLCKSRYRKRHYLKNMTKTLCQNAKWRRDNPERMSQLAKEWGRKHPERRREAVRKYNKLHPEKWKAYHGIPKIRLRNNISRQIGLALKGNKKGYHWESLVGYTLDELRKHLEKQFESGMTWENYGQWHIDHEIPVSAFNFSKPEHIDFKRCFALKNLRPLWKHENLSKWKTLIKPFQPALAF